MLCYDVLVFAPSIVWYSVVLQVTLSSAVLEQMQGKNCSRWTRERERNIKWEQRIWWNFLVRHRRRAGLTKAKMDRAQACSLMLQSARSLSCPPMGNISGLLKLWAFQKFKPILLTHWSHTRPTLASIFTPQW